MSQEVTYDQESDALYVSLAASTVERTRFLDDLRAVDYHGDVVVGVEFINASEGVDLSDVPFAEVVERLIRESGHQIAIFA